MTSVNEQITHRDEPLAPERVRADFYAIIGRLFYGAPDELLLAALTQSEGDDDAEGGAIGAAWRELREACRTAFPVVLKQEFDNLFVGVGKSEITPYTSHYVKETAPGRHLVRLRQLVEGWQLARRNAAFETEDHVSGVCDAMRHLISEGHPLEEQRLFFNEFVYSGTVPFCEAIERSPNASFYRCVAQFTRAFLSVEKGAFEMHED